MKFKTLVTVAALSLAMMACSKVNKENYDQLEMGMEYSEITAIIGNPDDCSETLGTKRCTWGDDAKNIKVSFIADKAIAFTNDGVK